MVEVNRLVSDIVQGFGILVCMDAVAKLGEILFLVTIGV